MSIRLKVNEQKLYFIFFLVYLEPEKNSYSPRLYVCHVEQTFGSNTLHLVRVFITKIHNFFNTWTEERRIMKKKL